MSGAADPAAALAAFGLRDIAGLRRLTSGHINASWECTGEGPLGARHYLLQRLNPAVFPDGPAVHDNIVAVTDHLRRAAAAEGVTDLDRRVLRLAPLPDGAPAWQDTDRAWWRLVLFIERATTVTEVGSPREAERIGAAFGTLHRWLRRYAGPAIHETLPGFHDSAARFARLEQAVRADRVGRVDSVTAELRQAWERRRFAEELPPLLASGAVPRRIAHNDAKASNVLLDATSGAPLAVVDLDTLMPGTLLMDAGDLVRSVASGAAEDERELERITVELPLVAGVARGFLAECGGLLTVTERERFVFAGLLLTWEQGVRFLTDYLEGDHYYAVHRPGQNLDRARAQFRLLEGLETHRRHLEMAVARL